MMCALASAGREAANKTFGDLLKEVYEAGRCTFCLVCLDACAREGCDAVSLVGDTFEYVASKCLGTGMCYISCPELESLDIALAAAYGTQDSEIGRVRLITSAMSADWAVKSRIRNGGVIPSILKYLLDMGEVDAAVMPAPAEATPMGLLLASQGEEAITPTGYKFRKPATTRFLRDLYRSRENPLRIALVSNPCQTRMVRKMQFNHVPPSQDVKVIFGEFCYATLSNARWRRSFFERAVGAEGRLIHSVEVRDDVRVTFHDGTVARVDLDELYLAFDSSCLSCVDYSNSLADISVGPAGSPEGFETVIVRTEQGERVLDGALQAGYLMEWTALFKNEDPEEFRQRLLDGVIERTRSKVRLSQQRGRVRV